MDEHRERLRAPLAVALIGAGLALAGGSLLAVGAVDVAFADGTRTEALSHLVAAGLFSSLVLGFGEAIAWRLVQRERARVRGAGARARLARLGLVASGLAQEMREPLQEARERLLELRERLEEQPAWSLGSGAAVEVCDRLSCDVERAETILHDFVEWARPEPVPPRIVDAALLVREWVAALEPELAARDVALVAEGASSPAAAIADPAGLKRIFWSLVRNARDASPRGSIVRVRIERHRDRIRILVADLGPGIEPERRDEVFEPFASTKPDGTGLGLAVSMRLAEAMGATLSVAGGPPGAVLQVALRRAPPAARYFTVEPVRRAA